MMRLVARTTRSLEMCSAMTAVRLAGRRYILHHEDY
jgi:hypothetical protein